MNSPQLSRVSIANLTLEENQEPDNPNTYRKRRWDELLVAASSVALPAEGYSNESRMGEENPWSLGNSQRAGSPFYYSSPPIPTGSGRSSPSSLVMISPSPSPTSSLSSVTTTRSRSYSSPSSTSSSPSPLYSPAGSPLRTSPPSSPLSTSLPRSQGRSTVKKALFPASKTLAPAAKKKSPLSNRALKLEVDFDAEEEFDNEEDEEEEEGDAPEKKENGGRKYGRKDLSYLLNTPIDLRSYLAAWLARHTIIETNGFTDPVYHCWKCVPPKGAAPTPSPQRTTAYIRIAVPRHLRAPGLPGKYQAHHVHAMNLGMMPPDPLKMVASRRCGHLWCVAPHHLVWETISENFLRERSGKCVGGDRCPHGPLKCFSFAK